MFRGLPASATIYGLLYPVQVQIVPGYKKNGYECIDCSKPVSRLGRRCQPCGCKERWRVNPHYTRECVEFEGVRYYLGRSGGGKGYYGSSPCTTNTSLQRAVWESSYGAIPEGYHVHHKYKNVDTTNVEDLELLSASEHAKLHGEERGPHREDSRAKMSESHKRLWADKQPKDFKCIWCENVFQSISTRAHTCSKVCNAKYWGHIAASINAAKRIDKEIQRRQLVCAAE